jgi:hypothetical protein
MRVVAESLAHNGAAAHRPARSRRSRVRAHVFCNLINYVVWSTYLGVGIAVAGSNGYLDHLSRFTSIVSAAGAVVLWPLVFIR